VRRSMELLAVEVKNIQQESIVVEFNQLRSNRFGDKLHQVILRLTIFIQMNFGLKN